MYNEAGSTTLTNCTFISNSAEQGGGMYNIDDSNPSLTNCTFSGNSATVVAGGMFNGNDSSPILNGCTFSGNLAFIYGGGLINYNWSNPTLTDCDFSGNSAAWGGGMHNWNSSPTLTNCTFNTNSAEDGGGMDNENYSRPILTNCTFTGNASIRGGGMGNYDRSSPILTNCTFSGNSAAEGGGMYNLGSNPRLTNCVFENNEAPRVYSWGGGPPQEDDWFGGFGGGMYNQSNSDPVLANCTFAYNTAWEGGGISNDNSNPSLNNCVFTGNQVWATRTPLAYVVGGRGGGMYNKESEPVLANCIFSGNLGRVGAGICNSDSTPTILRCTLINNAAILQLVGKGGKFASGGGIYGDNSILSGCIIWGNTPSQIEGKATANYCDVQGGFPGEGNIDIDPLFAKHGFWADVNDQNIVVEPNDPNAVWIDGDYHLKSQAGRWYVNEGRWTKDDVTSSCIDAGDIRSPIGNEPFPNGGIINMGAYGGTSEASKSYFGELVCETIVAGDINGDCKVNLTDFAIMALHWLEDNNP
jgi:hypothetical protein